MHDPEFQQPVEKFSDGDPMPVPPTCKLANVSLVFGILGFVPLPVAGSLIAIVTGHIALGEVRASDGRLGGRAAAKAGLILGYLAVVLAVLITTLIVGLTTRTVHYMTAAPTPRMISGVKMVNEMGQRDVDALKKLGLGDATGDEDIIASYRNATPEHGQSALAVLTSKRIAYLTSFDLKDIDAILAGPASEQKYTPNDFGSSYLIEIKRKSGGRMLIAIPERDGPLFSEALNDAWKAAGGKPEAAAKK